MKVFLTTFFLVFEAIMGDSTVSLKQMWQISRLGVIFAFVISFTLMVAISMVALNILNMELIK